MIITLAFITIQSVMLIMGMEKEQGMEKENSERLCTYVATYARVGMRSLSVIISSSTNYEIPPPRFLPI